MACLVHDSRYRSLFHAIVNELRNEDRTPVPVLRKMPSQCCACKDIDTSTLVSVVIPEKDTLCSLQSLMEQISRDKKNNFKLVLALTRLENFIRENRGPVLPTPAFDVDMHETRSPSSSTDSDDDTRRRVVKKSPKPLKNGTFLFLPYKFEEIPQSDTSLEAAKILQRGRFIGRNKYIQSFEEQHHVRINMITSATSGQIQQTLNNARASIGDVQIHNKEDLSEEENGEWILIREKKSKDKAIPTDLNAFLEELKTRWISFLKLQKHKNESDDNEEGSPNKK